MTSDDNTSEKDFFNLFFSSLFGNSVFTYNYMQENDGLTKYYFNP